MREGSPARQGGGWFVAVSFLASLAGILVLAAAGLDAALAGLSGKDPTSSPFVVGAACGMAAVGVAAVGAWAVGRYGGFDVPVRSVIYHWDGVAWERQSSLHVGVGANVLNGIATSSPSKAWGVGLYGDGTAARTSVAGC